MINQRQASAFINYLLNDKVYYLDRFNNSGEMRGIQPTTVNTYLKACKSVYQTLIDLEYIEVNPFQKLKTVKRQNEEGDGANFHLTNDNLVFEGGVFYRVK
ncbi:hypothetical protein DD888_13620 [Staphylococcus pseudintermedius]|nr:hypothetical protein DD888_13620 [Staphylococcus pseudintermedius]